MCLNVVFVYFILYLLKKVFLMQNVLYLLFDELSFMLWSTEFSWCSSLIVDSVGLLRLTPVKLNLFATSLKSSRHSSLKMVWPWYSRDLSAPPWHHGSREHCSPTEWRQFHDAPEHWTCLTTVTACMTSVTAFKTAVTAFKKAHCCYWAAGCRRSQPVCEPKSSSCPRIRRSRLREN